MRRVAIAVFGALTFSAAPAHAATFNVNTTQDPVSAGCTAVACSLRGALSAAIANGSLEDDVINVPAGTYEVTQVFGLSGVSASRITINGAGAGATVVQASGQIRIFNLGAQAGLTLRGLTVQGGRPTSDIGGNIRVDSARLTLDGVRVTDGQAPAGGGGIGAQSLGGTAVVTIARSLIDNNAAVGSSNGGGIALPAGTSGGVTTTITDSTIAYNASPAAGAGIALNSTSAPTLNGVTIAYNTGTTGAGGIQSSFSAASIQGSIFAGNRGANNAIHNCTWNGSVTDRGGNVEDINGCGFTNPGSRPNTNPQLDTDFDRSQPPALALPKTSPAVDLADCEDRTLDQRGVSRPQGLLCDAGAYEYMEPVVDPTPTPTPTPAPPVATPPPTATPVPTPVVNRTIVVGPARGTVRVKVPGSNRFVDLDATRGIPVGSTVDTRKGRVTLTSIPRAGAAPETAVFYDGLFRVTQSRGITNLTLTEQLARCPRKGRAASAAARKKSRKLWGDGKGAFRTSGRYSAATVRGTKWLVQDSCAGTLTRVTQGSVTVRHRNRTIVVRAGKRYLARPR